MPDMSQAAPTADYLGLGYVGNPFPPIDKSSADPHWMRLVTNAAANGLLSGILRAGAGERSRPVVVRMAADVPDYYYRASQNGFLSRTARDESLGMMALNVPLDMMRLGSIRGTLAEVAELVAAVTLGRTVGAYFAEALKSPDASLPEYAEAGPEALEAARVAFTDDPEAAMERFLGARAGLVSAGPSVEEDEALHQAYLRQSVLDVDPDVAQEAGTGEEPEGADHDREATGGPAAPEAAGEPAEDGTATVVGADDSVRDYLIALVLADLSPVIARALQEYEKWGESIVAQELKVTKAPRKTLSAILRLMSYRWKRVVVLYDRFDAWPMLEQQTRMDVLAALTELRWIIGEHGVMGVAIVNDQAVEIEEQFAAGEQVDWSLPELTPLYAGETGFDADRVQRWLDAAALSGVSAVRVDGPELAPLVAACEGDIQRFTLMAEVAFRNAAERASAVLDEAAVSAGLASVTIEDCP